MDKLVKGERLGPWSVVSKIQAGGNGVVWRVVDVDSKPAAIKVLTKPKVSAYLRFRGEVEILRTHQDIPGLMPVLGYHFPDKPTDEDPAWYVMPLAQDIGRAIAGKVRGDATLRARIAIEVAAEVAETLIPSHQALNSQVVTR